MLLNLEMLVKKYNMDIKGVIHIGAHFGEENNDLYRELTRFKNIECGETFFSLCQFNIKKYFIFVSRFNFKLMLL